MLKQTFLVKKMFDYIQSFKVLIVSESKTM